MEPAFSVVACATFATALVLAADLAVSGLGAITASASSLPRSVRSVALCASTVMLLVSSVRVGASAAATPPPAVRLAQTVSAGVGSTQVEAVPSHSDATGAGEYTVVVGDCLWRIARRALLDRALPASGAEVSHLWRAIYAANREIIGPDPDLIHPGQVLAIPEV